MSLFRAARSIRRPPRAKCTMLLRADLIVPRPIGLPIAGSEGPEIKGPAADPPPRNFWGREGANIICCFYPRLRHCCDGASSATYFRGVNATRLPGRLRHVTRQHSYARRPRFGSRDPFALEKMRFEGSPRRFIRG